MESSSLGTLIHTVECVTIAKVRVYRSLCNLCYIDPGLNAVPTATRQLHNSKELTEIYEALFRV